MQKKINHTTLPILAIGALGGTVSMRKVQPGAARCRYHADGHG